MWSQDHLLDKDRLDKSMQNRDTRKPTQAIDPLDASSGASSSSCEAQQDPTRLLGMNGAIVGLDTLLL